MELGQENKKVIILAIIGLAFIGGLVLLNQPDVPVGADPVLNANTSATRNAYIEPPVEKFNLNGVEHEVVRKKIDLRYKVAHDKLSKAYYDKLVYGTYGVLDEATFIKLQQALWAEYEILFNAENKKLTEKERIPEEDYNVIYDTVNNLKVDTGKTKSGEATILLNQLKNEGIEISI